MTTFSGVSNLKMKIALYIVKLSPEHYTIVKDTIKVQNVNMITLDCNLL